MRKPVCGFVVVLCLAASFTPIEAAAPASSPQQSILEIAAGAPVEVKLKAGPKFRGRLEEVRADSFDLKIAVGDELETRSLAFRDVKSVKALKGSQAGRIALYMLAGVGAFVMVVYAIAFSALD